MSNVIAFPVEKARHASAGGTQAGTIGATGDKSFGEVLLFTGIQYMRRHPQNPSAGTSAPPAGEEKQG